MTIANADQHAAWNGDSGSRWVATADRRDTVLAPIANLLLETAAITAGDRVLDIGCGCGATTLAAAAAAEPAGTVVGADLSAPMLDLARSRAAALHNVEFRQADVQTDPLPRRLRTRPRHPRHNPARQAPLEPRLRDNRMIVLEPNRVQTVSAPDRSVISARDMSPRCCYTCDPAEVQRGRSPPQNVVPDRRPDALDHHPCSGR